jgi:hypothetical protein
MSFGYQDSVKCIDRSIQCAVERHARDHLPVLLFAAASNYGFRKKESWPARHSNVLCVYAMDGNGNKYGKNPTAALSSQAFGVLGVEIEGTWNNGRIVAKSGTSTATPIAAGIAALFIGFMKDMRDEYLSARCQKVDRQEHDDSGKSYDELVQCLTIDTVMRALFKEISGLQRDGYLPIQPETIIKKANWDRLSLTENILAIIKEAT